MSSGLDRMLRAIQAIFSVHGILDAKSPASYLGDTHAQTYTESSKSRRLGDAGQRCLKTPLNGKIEIAPDGRLVISPNLSN